jgi:hypothetical protein
MVAVNLLAAALTAATPCVATSPAHTVALVELYTSQGCSSCPPADRWLSALPGRVPADRAIPIALHVGYWDYIGWKDPFARREFNDRQRRLADLNRNRTVYTPGVFIDGREAPDWRDPRAVDAAVAAANARPAAARIELAVAAAESSGLAVRTSAALAPSTTAESPQLYVALLQDGLRTDVKAGENRGERLANDRVTRDWRGPLALDAHTVTLAMPAASASGLTVVAFVQDKAGKILQAVQLPLASCATPAAR